MSSAMIRMISPLSLLVFHFVKTGVARLLFASFGRQDVQAEKKVDSAEVKVPEVWSHWLNNI